MSPMATTVFETDQLRAYRVSILTSDSTIPQELRQYLESHVKKARRDTPPSASAIASAQEQTITKLRSEAASIELLGQRLIGHTKDDGSQDSRLIWEAATQFERAYSPLPPTALVEKQYGTFPQPRPDRCVGYASQAFPEDHELAVVNRECISPGVSNPFLTAQFKRSIGGEGMLQAKLQSARDGASVNNYLHKLYTNAGQPNPSMVDTCHFSVTCDFDTARLWVHFRLDGSAGPFYHMAHVAKTWLEGEDERPQGQQSASDLELFRKYIRNIYDYALETRLDRIKQAVTDVYNSKCTMAEKAAKVAKPPSRRSSKRGPQSRIIRDATPSSSRTSEPDQQQQLSPVSIPAKRPRYDE